MAYRNIPPEERSNIGNRLQNLMKIKSEQDSIPLDSAKKLAAQLYDAGLVTVASRPTENDTEEELHVRAIQSIEKKILRHFRAESISELQGEFIEAYCKYFHCSADYLLGFTDILSDDIEVRRICEKTGLSEKAVSNLVNDQSMRVGRWSSILESDLFRTIPDDCTDLWYNRIFAIQEQAEHDAVRWCRDNLILDYDGFSNIEFDEQRLREDEQKRRFESAGIMAKISREFSNFIDEGTTPPDDYRENLYEDHYNHYVSFISCGAEPDSIQG